MVDIIVPILVVSLVWMAAVVYWIYKDHGLVEKSDREPYVEMFKPPTEDHNLSSHLRSHLRSHLIKHYENKE